MAQADGTAGLPIPHPLAMQDEDEKKELYEEIERRAFLDLPEDDDEAPIDLVAELKGEDGAATDEADITLGGYIAKHDRVPAFEGADGQPYTVDIDVELDADRDPPWTAFLVFIRWAATGAGIMDHCESGDVAHGESEDAAKAAALDLTLYEVKAELDAAIERRRRALEE